MVNLPDYNGQADGDISFVVPRSGDLCIAAWFHCVIPGICNVDSDGNILHDTGVAPRYCDGLGQYLLNTVSLEIGGTTICECYSHMLKIWDELSGRPGRKASKKSVDMSCSNIEERIDLSRYARRIIVSLDALTFLDHQPSLALPLVAIPFHQTKIRITRIHW